MRASDAPPPLALALLPVAVLFLLMASAVWLFGAASAAGPAQVALLAAAAVANGVGAVRGMRWAELERAAVESIGRAVPASLILLAVGALIGSWMLSGTAPTMVYLGLLFISPDWFYPAALLICAIVSVSIGSSWTTAGTVGLALVGAAGIVGLSPAVTAGAVVGGAYFGDKLSPLSDSTNLTAAVVGVDLFRHIRHMLTTTLPSLGLSLLLFAGFSLSDPAGPASVEVVARTRSALAGSYELGWLTLLPLVVVMGLALRRFPPYPTIAAGALCAGVVAVIEQPDLVRAFGDPAGALAPAAALLKGVWLALATGFRSELGVPELDRLLSRGGMASMLPIVWMVLAALSFSAAMEVTGLLQRLTAPLVGLVRGTGSLVAATVGTAIAMNVLAATQYMAIIIPGRMYLPAYRERGLAPVNLSRTVEDAGTMTSALVPWTTCGAFMAGALGVATLEYLPYAFVNLLNPLLALCYGWLGIALVPDRRAAAGGEPAAAS